MRWTERQQAMLRAMGVSIWQPGESAPSGAVDEALAEGAVRDPAPPLPPLTRGSPVNEAGQRKLSGVTP